MQCLLKTLLALCVGVIFSTNLAFGNKPNNVCRRHIDYYHDMQNNINCYYNPDIHLSAIGIIRRHGYSVKNYTAITTDGYYLTLFRIMPKNHDGQPIFLQHGFATSSMVFISRGNKSLAFHLADRGYDVWLGNFRGTRYSLEHKTLKSTDLEYWDFSFDELGSYDIPAQLEVVAKYTKEKIVYIGYSMGTTAYFVYNSKFPRDAERKLKLSISLAPVAFLTHTTTPYRILAPLAPFIGDLLYQHTNGALTKRTPETVETKAKLCLPDPIRMNICTIPLFLLAGVDLPQEDPETLPVTIMQHFDSMGVKTMLHYAQSISNKGFKEYDLGSVNNYEVYGTPTPPDYRLADITVPNYLIRGPGDPLATRVDVDRLYAQLPTVARPFPIHVIKYPDFNHMDFDSARDIKELLFYHLVGFLEDYLSTSN